MNQAARILIAVGAIVGGWLVMHPPQPNAAADNRPTLPGSGTFDRAKQFRGMSIQLHGGGPAQMAMYHKLCDELVGLGADSVLFVNHGWQTHAGTADLHFDPQRNPSLPELGELCKYAASKGLRVCVMPVVLLSAPRGSEWRGRINPTVGWDEWFKRYTQFIIEHAEVCEASKVEVMFVGSELIKAEQFTDRWKALIQEVRKVYHGRLGYSANWDHYATDKIGFWPYLDLVGMTSYYTLARGPNPTPGELLANWEPYKQRISTFYNEVRKPIVFTEAGWCSQEGAAKDPWDYYRNMNATEKGHLEQLHCYEAFIQTWGSVPFVGGIFWWEWNDYPGGANDFGYTPRDKPAEKLLRQWFGVTTKSEAPASTH